LVETIRLEKVSSAPAYHVDPLLRKRQNSRYLVVTDEDLEGSGPENELIESSVGLDEVLDRLRG
jgi:hypothetical protein